MANGGYVDDVMGHLKALRAAFGEFQLFGMPLTIIKRNQTSEDLRARDVMRQRYRI